MSNDSVLENEVATLLNDLSKKHIKFWEDMHSSLPKSFVYQDMPSICKVNDDTDGAIYWKNVVHKSLMRLDGVERGVEITLQNDIHVFYGMQFSGDIQVIFQSAQFNLLQAWNEEDFINLQENIIHHLVTQRKKKRSPTVFIGTTHDDDIILSICNLTGNVLLEQLSNNKRTILSENLIVFLSNCIPTIFKGN